MHHRTRSERSVSARSGRNAWQRALFARVPGEVGGPAPGPPFDLLRAACSDMLACVEDFVKIEGGDGSAAHVHKKRLSEGGWRRHGRDGPARRQRLRLGAGREEAASTGDRRWWWAERRPYHCGHLAQGSHRGLRERLDADAEPRRFGGGEPAVYAGLSGIYADYLRPQGHPHGHQDVAFQGLGPA